MSPAKREKIVPASRQDWRDWLERNHDLKAEVWLVFFKRHTGKPTLSYNDAVEEAICFGWIDGIRQSIDGERYMHRFSPRLAASKWSATNRKRAERMEKAGKMGSAGRAAIADGKRRGTWAAPRAEFDLSMPPELAARLEHNKRAAAFFESLAPSYRRQFLGWINAAKRPETRQKRLDEAVTLLQKGEKLGMR